jgi:hypothetical protein
MFHSFAAGGTEVRQCEHVNRRLVRGAFRVDKRLPKVAHAKFSNGNKAAIWATATVMSKWRDA